MQSLSRYKIIREVGRGGMGVVYEAFDPVLGRAVAIKTMSLSVSSSPAEARNLEERLLREARAAATLKHPNIITVYDILQEENATHIVMELVEGQTLEQMLSETARRPIQWCLQVLTEAAAALDYAHHRGVFHRDIKPANIMVDPEGHIKIADFGIAKLTGQTTLTDTGMMVGSPHYMTPEQLKGEPVTGSTDQFALASVAYTLLTGSRPFQGDTISRLFYQIVNEPAAVPTSVNPALSPAINRVFLKAMAKNPNGRYPTCTKFLEALKDASTQRELSETVIIRKRVQIPWIPIGAGCLVLLIAVIAFLVFKSGPATKHDVVQAVSKKEAGESTASTFIVPKIIGMKQADAADILSRAGLQIGSANSKQSETAPGTIIEQKPMAGSSLQNQGLVDIVIAEKIKPAKIPAPVVAGKRSDIAVEKPARIEPKKLAASPESQKPPDVIPELQPKTEIPSPQPSNVGIAKSEQVKPAAIPVPDIMGMKREDAVDTLSRKGFQIGTTRSIPSNKAPGTIIEQKPAAGSSLPQPSSVDIVIAELPLKPAVVWILDSTHNLRMINPNGIIIKNIAKPDTAPRISGSRAMVISVKGDFIVAAGSDDNDNRLGRYDLNGSNPWSIKTGHYEAIDIAAGYVYAIRAGEGRSLIKDTVQKIDSRTGRIVKQIELPRKGFALDIAVDESNKNVWIAGRGILCLDLDLNKRWTGNPVEGMIVSIDFAGDGTLFAVEKQNPGGQGSGKNRLLLIDKNGGTQGFPLRFPPKQIVADRKYGNLWILGATGESEQNLIRFNLRNPSWDRPDRFEVRQAVYADVSDDGSLWIALKNRNVILRMSQEGNILKELPAAVTDTTRIVAAIRGN